MQANIRIKQLREILNLSQSKFAKAISFSSGHIAEIELGNRKMNDRVIKLICSTFRVRENWLKYGDGDIFDGNRKDEKIEKINSLLQRMNPEFLEYVLRELQIFLDIQEKQEKKRTANDKK